MNIMKSKEEIEQMLHAEIANQKRLNNLFMDAIERGDNMKDIQALFIDGAKSTHRIIVLKEVLNHD